MEREKETCVVARPEKTGMSDYARNKFDTFMRGIKRREEIKKEFQDYLNNSCDRLREENQNDISSEKVNGRRSKED